MGLDFTAVFPIQQCIMISMCLTEGCMQNRGVPACGLALRVRERLVGQLP